MAAHKIPKNQSLHILDDIYIFRRTLDLITHYKHSTTSGEVCRCFSFYIFSKDTNLVHNDLSSLQKCGRKKLRGKPFA